MPFMPLMTRENDPNMISSNILRSLVLLSATLTIGCGWDDLFSIPLCSETVRAACYDPDTTGGSTGSTSTGPTRPAIQTTTEDPDTSTSGTTGAGETGTTTAPQDPEPTPTLVTLTVPNKIEAAGPLPISVIAEDADRVTVQLDDAAPFDLLRTGPDTFIGEAPVYSWLANGTHDLEFTPWRGALTGATRLRQFTAALPPGGGEAYWEASGELGVGVIEALAVASDGTVHELLTLEPNVTPRCHLRRRDAGGKYGVGDTRPVLPDQPCRAVDLAVAADGSLYVLAELLFEGDPRWWLGNITAWADAPVKIGGGALGEVAHALALAPDDTAVVCGTRNGQQKPAAKVWGFRPGKPGFSPDPFQYKLDPADLDSKFIETPTDCAFNDGALALVGEVYGKHDQGAQPERNRLFLLEYDLATEATHWTVLGPGIDATTVQSGASALTVTAVGEYAVSLYTCGDKCSPKPELRLFAPGGAETWRVSLGADVLTPTDLAWSPAGYLVIASARVEGPWVTSFWLRALVPHAEKPVWTYGHDDAPVLQFPKTVAVGPYAVIYTGGVGAGEYPALAVITP